MIHDRVDAEHDGKKAEQAKKNEATGDLETG
jgi:hypothetical protein